MISSQIEKATKHIYLNDERLAEIITAAGTCTLKPRKQYFYALIKAIIGQQLSGQAADSITRKFFLHYQDKPSSDQIINTTDEVLRSLGLSYQKIRYIKDLASKVSLNEINLKKIGFEPDDVIINELIKVKGIGIWTVQMFLIFTLNRLNVLPLNDLGIRKGIMKVYKLHKMPDEKRIQAISKKYNWSPYNSIASWYLWKSLEL